MFLLFCKCLSKECCLNKVIFSVTIVQILHHIQHTFSFRVQPVRNMIVTTMELLYYQDCVWIYQYVLRDLIVSNRLFCLYKHDQSPWTYEDEKFNTSRVILCSAELSNFLYKLLTLTKINKKHYMVKEDIEDFYEFHFSFLFYSSFSLTWPLSRVYEKVNWQNCFEFLFIVGGRLFL